MIPALFILPILASLVAWLAGNRRAGSWLGIITGLLLLLLSSRLSLQVWQTGLIRYPLGNWPAPLGIQLHADGLSVLLLLLTSVIGLAVTLYAHAWLRSLPALAPARRLFWPLWLLLWGGLNALFLSADAFNLYLLLELVTLAGVSLAALA
jgi:multicomponent Na+:H+ antiporter subunit D